MKAITIRATSLAAFALLIAGLDPARAAGPVDGEVTALYWASHSSVESSTPAASEHSYDAAARAELWFVKKFGLSASYYNPNFDATIASVDRMKYQNLDLKWRFLSPTQNNFLALGAGWQTVDVAGIGAESTSGPRLIAEGRVSFVKVLYGYARAAWIPKLKDFDFAGVEPLTDGKGYDGEAGLQIKPMAFMQIFIGYRKSRIDFSGTTGDVAFDHDGPILGFGFNF